MGYGLVRRSFARRGQVEQGWILVAGELTFNICRQKKPEKAARKPCLRVATVVAHFSSILHLIGSEFQHLNSPKRIKFFFLNFEY
jgi:hypothetical protein